MARKKGGHYAYCGGPGNNLARVDAEKAKITERAEMDKQFAAVEAKHVGEGGDGSKRLRRRKKQS
jgi:hypothetical protein